MRTLAEQPVIPAKAKQIERIGETSLKAASGPAGFPSLIHRKASCACGGGCPSCQARAGNLKVSQPNDAAEIEADAVADRVMRMPAQAPIPTFSRTDSANSIQRKCSACED